MTQEAYVSFETAKLLKEKGFNAEIDTYYPPEGKLKIWCPNGIKSYLDNNGTETWWWKCIAPTQQMAMCWLREMHNIHIIAEPCLGEGNESNLCFNRWFWTILKEDGEYEPMRKIDEFPTYEQAIEAAIQYSLKNLI